MSAKTKELYLPMRHGYSPLDANPVFTCHGYVIIIIIIIIITIIIITIIIITIIITPIILIIFVINDLCYFVSFLFHFLFDLIVCFYSDLFTFTFIITLFFGYIFSITYDSKVRAVCIIVQYNDGSKALICLSGSGRSCLAFARSEMIGLPSWA